MCLFHVFAVKIGEKPKPLERMCVFCLVSQSVWRYTSEILKLVFQLDQYRYSCFS